ncbi:MULTISPECIES: patatin-like phospholipase family protein [unclassified Oceanispirochaeta]|uniref:patatin-like phospholipase family protein n=1 Tax=unclassified Oceanispirochaeta TaxID=2635722 RepID=UPI000E097FCE|nr:MULTISPECIES: patatin-like phospholipase family protein [unclassified Oceanispirochaeta]MBF9014112.1 patatin-like phospholipase family protein [Oceanispirochaeta sp. M2]NPD70603.1 patatin-like phospholipase family protein [Oceanispirochaeta sp. M1]RDG34368.1 patatin-like phospholipase family protein [Oceanispirochaeta sp. M1]
MFKRHKSAKHHLSHHNEKYCLILSGGGAKGVYHVGAWRALSEIGVEVEAFIGNSIGAILAGFLAQNKIQEMEDIGANIAADFIMNIPEEFLDGGNIHIGKANLAAFKKFYHSVIEKKGIDVSPLRELLYKNLSEKAIRKSGNELGVVTFNVSDFKPQYVFLDDMAEGTVLDYLMASAAFPGLEQTVINGKSFIDGGVVDNMPYEMARERGYKNIIVVDISGMGINKKPNIQGTSTIYIKNSIQMGWIFDFSKSFLHDFNELGYLDTKKVFGYLKGEKYFFKPHKKFEHSYQRYIKSSEARSIIDFHLPDLTDGDYTVDQKIRMLLPESMRRHKDLLYCLADCAASIFQVKRVHEYSLRELVETIREKKEIEDERIVKLKMEITPSQRISLAKNLEFLFKEVRREVLRKDGERDTPYYDYCLCTEVLEWGQKILVKGLMVHHKELAAGLLATDFLFNKY